MNKIFTLILYILWTVSLIGLLIITFSNFQYTDLNTIVIILFIFTIINTFFAVKRK